jgi:TP901 family phage tail tape measure protein
MAINRDVNVSVNVIVNSKTVSAGIKATESQFKSFFNNVSKLALGFSIGNIVSDSLMKVRQSIAATIAEVVKYDQTLKSVQKTTDMSDAEIQKLSDTFLELSTRLPISAQQLAEVATQAGRLGIKGTKALEGFAENVSKTAVALEISAGEAAESLAQVANSVGINLSKTPGVLLNIASAVNSLDDSSATSSPRIIDALVRIGGAAKGFGKTSVDNLAALSTAMLEQGVSAEETGTAIKNAFIFASTHIEDFAKVMGVSVSEASQMLQQDGVGALQRFAQAAQKAGDSAGSLNAIAEVFGSRSSKALFIMAGSSERVAQLQKLANDEFIKGTSVLTEYERQSKGAEQILNLLKNQFTTAAIEIGLKFIPALKTGATALIELFGAARQGHLLDALAASISSINPAVKTLASTITSLGTSFLIVKNFDAIKATISNFVTSTSTSILSLQSSVLKARTSLSDLFKPITVKGVVDSLKAFKTNLTWAFAANPGRSFSTSMKTAMLQFKLLLRQGIIGFDMFKINLIAGFKSLQIGAKLWAFSMKAAMAGATLGLSIIIDVLINYALEFVETVGGWSKAFDIVMGKMKEFGKVIATYVIDHLTMVLGLLAKLPFIGSKIQSMIDGLNGIKGAMNDTAEEDFTDSLSRRAAAHASSVKTMTAEEKAAYDERTAQTKDYLKGTENLTNENNKKVTALTAEEQDKRDKEALAAFEKQQRKILGLTMSLEEQKNKMQEDLGVESLTKRLETEMGLRQTYGERLAEVVMQKSEEQLTKQLDTEYGLKLTLEERLQDIRLKKMEEARTRALKDAKEVADVVSSNFVSIFEGGQFSKFNQLKASQGTGAAVAGAVGSGLTAMGKGAQGGADLAKDVLKTAASAIPVIGPIMAPLIDMMSMSGEQLRETIRGFIDASVQIPLQIIENIPVIIEELLNGVPRVIEGLLEGLPRVIDGLVEGLPRVIEGFVNNLPTLIDRLVGMLPRFIESMITNFTLGFPMMATRMVTALAGKMPMVAVSFATSMVQQAPRIVTEVIKGLGDGIKNIFKNFNPFGGGGGGGGIFGSIGKIFKFAEGGVVPGNSYVGDQINARVNSGERILTARQNNLFEQLIDSSTDRGQAGGTMGTAQVGPAIGTVNIVINGSGVTDEKKLTDMIIERLRTESQRGRKIIQASGIGA